MNVKSLYNGPPFIMKMNINTAINEEIFETIDRVAKLNDIIDMVLFALLIDEGILSILVTFIEILDDLGSDV